MADTCSRIKSVDTHSLLSTHIACAFGSSRLTADWNAMVALIKTFMRFDCLFKGPSGFSFVVFHWLHVRF